MAAGLRPRIRLESLVGFAGARIMIGRVAQLVEDLRSTLGRREKDWRRTVGAFTDDEGMKEILQDAMRRREADRKKARADAKRSARRRTKQ